MAGQVIILIDVVVSFPHLIEARTPPKYPTSKPKFSVDFIVPPDHPGLKLCMEEVYGLMVDKWKGNGSMMMGQLMNREPKHRPFGGDADKMNRKVTPVVPYAGYQGMRYIKASSETAPQVLDSAGAPMVFPTEDARRLYMRKFYGGCHVNAAVKFYLWEEGRSASGDLLGIQFLRDGAPFGEGKVDLTGKFGAVPNQPPAEWVPGMPAVPGVPAAPAAWVPGMPAAPAAPTMWVPGG